MHTVGEEVGMPCHAIELGMLGRKHDELALPGNLARQKQRRVEILVILSARPLGIVEAAFQSAM